jgi:mannosyltransferase
MKNKSKKGKTSELVAKVNEPVKDYCIYILIGLVVLGSLLRLYHLGFNSLWLDEISTYKYSIGSFEGMWQMMATGTDYSPPLFFFLEHFVLQAFGVSKWSMRLLPAFFSVLTIPAIYLVGKEFQDKYVGLIAAAIFTFSPFLIYYAQDARPYSLALFFVTVMMIFYLLAEKHGGLQDWALFGVFAALAFWTHYYTVVFAAALISYSLIGCVKDLKQNLKTIKNIGVSIGVLILLTLPLLAALVPVYAQRTAAAPTYGIQGFGIVYETIRQMSLFSDPLAWILIIAWGIIVFFVSFDINEKHKGRLLLWITAVMFTISIFMSYKIPMLPRYLIFLMIPFALGIGMGYLYVRTVADREIKPIKIVVITAIIFALLAVPYGLQYYQNYSKEDWRGIGKDLKSIIVPGDTVVNVPLYIGFPLDIYFNASSNQVIETGVMSVEELDPIRKSATQSVYYVLTPDIYAADPAGKSVDWLKQNAVLVRNYGSVWILKGV